MQSHERASGLRIVSLLASATEIVAALGFADNLVACSHECDYPPAVRGLPRCTAPKFEVAGGSREIDRQVKAIVEEGLSVYRVDGTALRALRPDVIVTQSQCEVCAVSERDLARAVADWMGADRIEADGDGPRIVSLKPDDLAGIWRDIESVADALGVPDRGTALVRSLRSRMTAIRDGAESQRRRPRIACIEWIDPLMAAGNWMPELVALAGGENLFGEAGRHSPWMGWDDLLRADPDVIAVMPCGFDIAKTRSEMPALTRQPGWDRLRAVGAGRIFVTDGSQYFNRPGPRIAESLEILAELIHPERFAFGHEGRGWQRL